MWQGPRKALRKTAYSTRLAGNKKNPTTGEICFLDFPLIEYRR